MLEIYCRRCCATLTLQRIKRRATRETFTELSDYFEKHYVKAAEYVDGRKVGGVRSLGTGKGQLNVLRGYFGCCRSRSITHGDIRQFRTARLAQETRTKTQRTIASVNRELLDADAC